MVERRVVCPKMKIETSIYMNDELVNLHAEWWVVSTKSILVLNPIQILNKP